MDCACFSSLALSLHLPDLQQRDLGVRRGVDLLPHSLFPEGARAGCFCHARDWFIYVTRISTNAADM
eukprot:6392324-Lingulodinium_polyedra.AAC.1